MTRKEIKFTDIVQMIADGTVADGAKFYTHGCSGSSVMISASMSGKGDTSFLYWDENKGDPSENQVQLSQDVMSDKWYIEVPEVELSLQEALQELKQGYSVKAVDDAGSYFTLDGGEDMDDMYLSTPLCCLEDLLDYTFYKVAK